MLKVKRTLWILVMAICLIGSGSVSADFVANPGFEDQVLAEGGYSYAIPSWNSDGALTYVVNPDPVAWPYAVAHSGDNVMMMASTGTQYNHVYEFRNHLQPVGVCFAAGRSGCRIRIFILVQCTDR